MKKIGIIFGMDDVFPSDVVNYIKSKNVKGVSAQFLKAGAVPMDQKGNFSIIFDRATNEVPFFKPVLKKAVIDGCRVINNPFWSCADDNFFHSALAAKIGIKVPRTVVLPAKEHLPGATSDSFRNLVYPLNWEEVFDYIGFPAYIKPNLNVSGINSYKVYNRQEFFTAYDFTGTKVMLLQESIETEEYMKCFVIGKKFVRIIRYNPGKPLHLRYVSELPEIDSGLRSEIENICLKISESLGFDFNTIEIAVKDGLPFAIDFLNPIPSIEKSFLPEDDYNEIVAETAEMLIAKTSEGKSSFRDIYLGSVETDTKSKTKLKSKRKPGKKKSSKKVKVLKTSNKTETSAKQASATGKKRGRKPKNSGEIREFII